MTVSQSTRRHRQAARGRPRPRFLISLRNPRALYGGCRGPTGERRAGPTTGLCSIGDQAIGACVARVCSPLSDPAKLASTAALAILERMNPAENNHATTRPGGITGNGFKPGQSGNPGGRPKGLAKTVRDACGGSPLCLAHVLLEITKNPKAHDRDRVAACRELLDRGWGKAPAYASMEADDPLELSDIAREIQADCG